MIFLVTPPSQPIRLLGGPKLFFGCALKASASGIIKCTRGRYYLSADEELRCNPLNLFAKDFATSTNLNPA
jgi:hypothetical protein